MEVERKKFYYNSDVEQNVFLEQVVLKFYIKLMRKYNTLNKAFISLYVEFNTDFVSCCTTFYLMNQMLSECRIISESCFSYFTDKIVFLYVLVSFLFMCLGLN